MLAMETHKVVPPYNTGMNTTPVNLATNQPAQLQWQGPTQLKQGESFPLQLTIQSEQPIFGLPLAVGFDPKIFQVISVTEGDFLKQGGIQTTSPAALTKVVRLSSTRTEAVM
jgi:general secretion pathway protein D